MDDGAVSGRHPAISVVGVRKTYRRTTALHDLSLEVAPGEVFGLLGPNGAGKTTAMKILVGLVRPSGGEARLFGHPAGRPAARRDVGYLPEHCRFPGWLTGEALLDLHARLAGLGRRQRSARIPEVLSQVGLAGQGAQRLRSYSKGMSQRLGLAQALVACPRLVLLDEPTSALDPVGRRAVREAIRALRDAGTTVFLNSHLLSEVEMVCERVAVVDHGRVVATGSLDDLLGGAPQVRVTLEPVDDHVLGLLGRYGQVVAVDASTVTVAVAAADTAADAATDAADIAADIAASVVGSGYRLKALVPVRRSLEDVFVGLVDGGQDGGRG